MAVDMFIKIKGVAGESEDNDHKGENDELKKQLYGYETLEYWHFVLANGDEMKALFDNLKHEGWRPRQFHSGSANQRV